MAPELYALLGVFLSAISVLTGKLWKERTNGPAATSLLVKSTTEFTSSVLLELASLRDRVAKLEEDNRRYHLMFGPLPDLDA